MFRRRIRFIFAVVIILSLSIISIAQAAPPRQGPEDGGLTTTANDSFNLDEHGNNLGTIMSGSKNSDDGGADTDGDNGTEQHPVADAMAAYFADRSFEDLTPQDVMDLHLQGYGFGVLAKAFYFADEFGIDYSQLAELLDGEIRGWRRVLNALEGDLELELVVSMDNGHGNRLEGAGPPGQAGKPDHTGKPDHAGKPDHVSNGNGGQGITNLSGPGSHGKGNSNGSGNNKNNSDGNGNGNGKSKGKGNGGGQGRGNN